MTLHRSEGALLAGACAGTARTFGWNVWALRALFVVFLLVKTLWAVLAYAALALLFHFRGEAGERRAEDDLGSPELATRNRRIAELEKRFRDLEQG
jgi:phage shock protein PspC (stress-responsive transcriptional regulator)